MNYLINRSLLKLVRILCSSRKVLTSISSASSVFAGYVTNAVKFGNPNHQTQVCRIHRHVFTGCQVKETQFSTKKIVVVFLFCVYFNDSKIINFI